MHAGDFTWEIESDSGTDTCPCFIFDKSKWHEEILNIFYRDIRVFDLHIQTGAVGSREGHTNGSTSRREGRGTYKNAPQRMLQ